MRYRYSGKGIVITGIGVVAPNGLGCEGYVEGLRAGRTGIRPLPFDASTLKVHHAASVANFDGGVVLSAQDLRRTPRAVHLAAGASAEALAMAGLGEAGAAERYGVILGSGGGGLSFVESQYKIFFSGERGYSPFTITAGTHGNLSSELSIRFGMKGPSHCVSTGCTSSTDAIGYAAMQIQCGMCPGFLVGGADGPIAEGILRGFELMRILAADCDPPGKMSRPFAADRDGFVLGEGSWMFVVEDAEAAAARGAEVLAEVLGYGSTCDAYHRVQPSPEATESARAIEMAMERCDPPIRPEQIGYVNLHGTGTMLNDVLETKALHMALGAAAKKTPMSATKSMIGHPQGASGAAGIAATILCARAGFAHGTVNLDRPGDGCDLDYIAAGPRPMAGGLIALCNCIAFGSKNSALVVGVR